MQSGQTISLSTPSPERNHSENTAHLFGTSMAMTTKRHFSPETAPNMETSKQLGQTSNIVNFNHGGEFWGCIWVMVWVLCCLMTPGFRKDIWCHVRPYSFLCSQITRADFRLQRQNGLSTWWQQIDTFILISVCGYVWVHILTLSSPKGRLYSIQNSYFITNSMNLCSLD